MGGKGEQGEQKLRATQDQLRIARITQDASSVEDDRANIQKLIKKVVETTRCNVMQAEIALYDADNNVEEAVNAILEDAYTDANVWKEQKRRKSKKEEAEEKSDEFISTHRSNRSHPSRGANNFNGSGRPRGMERGRGGFRGGARSGRGGYTGRGGHQSSAARFAGNSGSQSNVWDNSQATKTVSNKEWTNPAAPIVDDTPEETDWESAGTLVFSRREDVVPPVVPPTSAASGINSISTSTVSAPISFAAVAAAGANKAKESSTSSAAAQAKVPTSTGTVAAVPPATSPSKVNGVNQATVDSFGSIYQSSDIVSTSGQLTSMPAVSADEGDHTEEEQDDAQNAPAASLSSAHSGGLRSSQPMPSVTPGTGGGSSAAWTAQLKNDLGIGTKATSKPAVSVAKPVTPSKPSQPSVPKISQSVASHQPSYSVEFVSGEPNDSSALPEYQFGFHVDTSANTEEPTEDSFAISKRSAKNEAELMSGDSASTVLTNGGSSELASSISSQQQAKVAVPNSGVGIPSVSTAVHSSSGIQRQPATSGLSLADTSSMSYPSPENRSSVAKPPLSLHQQQQAQHPLYTTTQFPYSSYPYMNMYSPVTGVRQDETQYATLVQYPFAGMGQIDMSSLSGMIPPLAPQQQPSQPPPPVQQSQHQQRPDQHGNFVDLKAYATAAGVTISSAAGGTGSGLLSNQQQQQRADTSVTSSTVAPPPGFSGPPSNIPTAAFTLPQPNHLSSLFQMPPTYHPQLNQLPFSFMLPSVTGNGQHKLGHQIFAQQTVDDNLSEQRLSSQQQKVYGGGHQQMDKYGSTGGNKDRLGGGAQATPPPQMYQSQAPQGYLSQQVPHHAHNKKSYTTPQHWGAS